MENEAYTIGDLVCKTTNYSANYPTWKVEKGVILSVKKRMVSDQSLSTSDKALYRGRYKVQEKYPIFEMIISTPTGDYLVSQFGFNKDLGD